MTLILSIETATTVCSVALHEDGSIRGSNTFYLDKSHSTLLVPAIDSLVSRCGYKKENLSAVAISEGPGSYTGLRIGTSTAKGLCFALDIPLISVNTLFGIAGQVAPYVDDNLLLCPMLDARRMEVYTCLLSRKLEIVQDVHPLIVDENSFQGRLDTDRIAFFGNGSDKCKAVIDHPNALFIEEVEPSADQIGYLAYRKFMDSTFEDVAYFEPFYLKEFRATTPKARV